MGIGLERRPGAISQIVQNTQQHLLPNHQPFLVFLCIIFKPIYYFSLHTRLPEVVYVCVSCDNSLNICRKDDDDRRVSGW